MSEDTVTIEVNGQPLSARKGQMVIEVTDANRIYIPRFCYHKKLSVAANCRMCLVEVEKAPKPLPACATPVSDGMKVFTRSPLALDAQKSVMEFLLINHPLDCPICDQGGECELQDLAMGYGSGVSQFTERKRVVKDKNIGPLVQTDMTRCIHCTRCVRFGEEIAGLRELGATGRGEHMEIGTYVEKAMTSELSGNVIDLCPVGALTNKPFRYSARTWEMRQCRSVAPHDAVGSNLYLHVKNQAVMRVVPAENEAINEVWLSDRDRYSYEGLNSTERLLSPLIKVAGEWHEVDWEVALDRVHDALQVIVARDGPQAVGGLAAPWATLEELYLFQKWLRGLGVNNLDHRLRQVDFRDDAAAPLFPALGQPLAELERADAVLLIGSHVRKEQPLINHRLRKAAMRGAAMLVVNPADYDFNINVTEKCIVPPAAMVATLAGVARALLDAGCEADPALRRLLDGVSAGTRECAIAAQLNQAERPSLLLGMQALAHPDFSLLRSLANAIAVLTGARLGYLADGGNCAGAWLAGVLPHRGPAGTTQESAGFDAMQMFEQPCQAYVLLGLEPDLDCWNGSLAMQALARAECVVAFSAYRHPGLMDTADVLLPMALFAETAGTFVNIEGVAQSFAAAVTAPALARPAWKILRVLGNRFGLAGFASHEAEEIRAEVMAQWNDVRPDNTRSDGLPDRLPQMTTSRFQRIGQVPANSLDPLTRHAPALQQTADVADGHVHLCPADAQQLHRVDGDRVRVTCAGQSVELPVRMNATVPAGCVLIHAAHPDTVALGGWFGTIELERI